MTPILALRVSGLALAVLLTFHPAVAAQSWEPPLGIPAPPFGITQTAPASPSPWTSSVAGFYYVDASAAASTDSGNPYGTPGLPRKTIPTSLPAGSVVELRGLYTRSQESPNGIVANGTVGSPVFIRGASKTNRPVATGSWQVSGSYLIVENIEFAGTAPVKGIVLIRAPAQNIAVRHCEVRGTLNGGGLAAVSFSSARSQNIVVYDNYIHDNGDVTVTYDQDVHGIEIGQNQSYVWILDNEMARNSGDGLQANSNGSSHHLFLGRNLVHENKQTGMCRRGTPTSSSPRTSRTGTARADPPPAPAWASSTGPRTSGSSSTRSGTATTGSWEPAIRTTASTA